jgi:hypothetical protein
MNGHRRHEVRGIRQSHSAPLDFDETRYSKKLLETEESDAQEREGMRERWDSRRRSERHGITLQVTMTAVNAWHRHMPHKTLFLWSYIYFFDEHPL